MMPRVSLTVVTFTGHVVYTLVLFPQINEFMLHFWRYALCFLMLPRLRLFYFHLQLDHIPIGNHFVQRDSPQRVWSSVLRASPHAAGLCNCKYWTCLTWFQTGAAVTTYWADWITVNTPHTTGRSDKIILRTIKSSGLSQGLLKGKDRTQMNLIILWCVPSFKGQLGSDRSHQDDHERWLKALTSLKTPELISQSTSFTSTTTQI